MIQIDGGKTAFAPGETLRGAVSWEGERSPGRVELRLFWYTTGRGSQDVGIVEVQQFPPAPRAEPIPFTFMLPAGPYSVAGQFIKVNWALELVLRSNSCAERFEFSMSPGGKPIELGSAIITG